MLISERMLWRIYAGVYPTVTSSYPYRDMMRAVASRIPAGSRLVDVGCGTGALLEHVAAPTRYLGIDRQAAMLQSARRLAEARRLQGGMSWRETEIVFREGSIYDPVAWGEPDCVVLNNAFYVLADKARALGIIRQQLGPGGRLVLCDPIGRPRIMPVLRDHFARYRADHGAAKLRRHQLGMLWRLLVIGLVNRRILDQYAFVQREQMQAMLEKAGFARANFETVYAGQNQLIVATWTGDYAASPDPIAAADEEEVTA